MSHIEVLGDVIRIEIPRGGHVELTMIDSGNIYDDNGRVVFSADQQDQQILQLILRHGPNRPKINEE